MFLFPIKKRECSNFPWAIEKDSLGDRTTESLIDALHNAACVPNGEKPLSYAGNSFIDNKKDYYQIYLNSINSKKSSDLSYRLNHFGVVRAYQKEKWLRDRNRDGTLTHILAVMQSIERSPYLSFPMLVIDKSLFSVLFENNSIELYRDINNLATGNNSGIMSLLSMTYTLLRPFKDKISKTKQKEKREFVDYMIKTICEQAPYLQENELLSLCSTIESDFGATFKNALLKVIQQSDDWSLRLLAVYLTKKYNFSRNQKGIDAFFDYIERFDGFDISYFLGEETEGCKKEAPNSKRIGNIINNIPHNFVAYFLKRLFTLADAKQFSIEYLLHQHIDAIWQENNPTGFIYKLLHQKYVDDDGIARIENMLKAYTKRLSAKKNNAFKEAFLFDKSKRFNWNCCDIYHADDPYAFMFIQTWLNEGKCMPPTYIHQAIQLDAIRILEFFKQQQGFNILYNETVEDTTIRWDTVRCINIKDETLQFIGRCLAESGRFDAISLNELLDIASSAKKTLKPAFKYLNEYLVTPITTGNIEIKSMKHARTYMTVFGVSPLEILPLATKDDTKHRLLKELVR